MNDTPKDRIGLLTKRQMEIIRLRKKGLSLGEIAASLGTTRQNVSILERRAHAKIQQAAATLTALQSDGIAVSVSIKAGTHLLDALKTVIGAADESGIRLEGNMVDLLSWFRNVLGRRISSGVLVDECTVIILDSGRCILVPK
ncbi:MAG: Tfx family DNA-binding protein [Candidatus Thermoplasmatota archaeon]|nr:Tfx family DNA-binding protein [Candidatus Thermoplasmatota archaeon]